MALDAGRYSHRGGFIAEAHHHLLYQADDPLVHQHAIDAGLVHLVQYHEVKIIHVRRTAEEEGMQVVILKEPARLTLVMLLEGLYEGGSKVKYRTDIRLIFDMACDMFTAGF